MFASNSLLFTRWCRKSVSLPNTLSLLKYIWVAKEKEAKIEAGIQKSCSPASFSQLGQLNSKNVLCTQPLPPLTPAPPWSNIRKALQGWGWAQTQPSVFFPHTFQRRLRIFTTFPRHAQPLLWVKPLEEDTSQEALARSNGRQKWIVNQPFRWREGGLNLLQGSWFMACDNMFWSATTQSAVRRDL